MKESLFEWKWGGHGYALAYGRGSKQLRGLEILALQLARDTALHGYAVSIFADYNALWLKTLRGELYGRWPELGQRYVGEIAFYEVHEWTKLNAGPRPPMVIFLGCRFSSEEMRGFALRYEDTTILFVQLEFREPTIGEKTDAAAIVRVDGATATLLKHPSLIGTHTRSLEIEDPEVSIVPPA